MLGWFRKAILKRKQTHLKKRYPQVNITLHADMPSVSINKAVKLAAIVNQVNQLESAISALSDDQLRQKTESFKEHIRKKSEEYQGQIDGLESAFLSSAIQEEKEKIKEKLKNTRNKIYKDILPEAFAVVRETAKRTIGMRHFDVQILGGIVLHEGTIAEMTTGEGKTLVATLPAYLNALSGRGVHVVTVNDYLARRDREWMGPVYEFLGLTVGAIQHEMNDEERQTAYACDITYGTNNEFGFDYLRDNMKYSKDDLVQRPFYFAILDEVDSILVDEARTPLIISGPAGESTDKYYTVNKLIPRLKGRIILEKDEIDAKFKGEDLSSGYDYIVDEKAHTAHLTEDGETKACQILGVDNLHELHTMDWRHHIIQGLRAYNLYKRDIDYVLKDGQVIIVDEFTGRMMPGRRWSDGLHQAVEAKEGLKIERENQTLATITFQNYFRMYEKLSGMTGTAFTEANEFKAIYKLDVDVIPTNKPLIRQSYPDCVYKTEEEKIEAVVEEIIELYNMGRPVLVGTISISKSELFASILKRRGIPHQVLNAKYHEMEAQIIAQAGRFKGVTIATNMAGRGTDILLGGNPQFMATNLLRQKMTPVEPDYQQEYATLLDKYKKETDSEHDKVIELGGLHVLGTERHEARRIDNQLRGRCGRQGDPGSSRFYVSLGDDLMRLFGSDRIVGLMERLGLERGQVIEHPWVTKSIEIAQRRVEQHNFEVRRQILEYDNVMNKQREVVYGQRRSILEGASLKDEIEQEIADNLEMLLDRYLPEESSGQEWNLEGLLESLRVKFGIKFSISQFESIPKDEIREIIHKAMLALYQEKEGSSGPEAMRHLERMVFLQIIDSKWKDHLYAMDSLREGISLRAYGQRDPLIEYKREGFSMFQEMVSSIRSEAVETIFKMQPVKSEKFQGVFSSLSQELLHPEAPSVPPPQSSSPPAPISPPPPGKQSLPKVGRNDPCPCGKLDPTTGRPIKYKKCHGK